MDFFEILKNMMLPNRDNGMEFTNTERIEKITALLQESKYRKVNEDGLFLLYAADQIAKIEHPVLISSHIDCVEEITGFFSKEYGDDMILGTYDNGITNAAVLYLMLTGKMPNNVLVAFTGDEECSAAGARQVVDYLTKRQKKPVVTIVLDVTDMGWDAQVDFTVENNFWDDNLGKKIIGTVQLASSRWRFVPSDEENVPQYVGHPYVIYEEAEEDESWEYDEHNWTCFSFCLPTCGPMHSNEGLLARKSGCMRYMEGLAAVADALAKEL